MTDPFSHLSFLLLNGVPVLDAGLLSGRRLTGIGSSRAGIRLGKNGPGIGVSYYILELE